MATQPKETTTAEAAELTNTGATFPAVIDPNFATFADELREMVNYFIDYRKTAGRNDGKAERVSEIEAHLNATAELLGELVCIDFLEATYYAD